MPSYRRPSSSTRQSMTFDRRRRHRTVALVYVNRVLRRHSLGVPRSPSIVPFTKRTRMTQTRNINLHLGLTRPTRKKLFSGPRHPLRRPPRRLIPAPIKHSSHPQFPHNSTPPPAPTAKRWPRPALIPPTNNNLQPRQRPSGALQFGFFGRTLLPDLLVVEPRMLHIRAAANQFFQCPFFPSVLARRTLPQDFLYRHLLSDGLFGSRSVRRRLLKMVVVPVR